MNTEVKDGAVKHVKDPNRFVTNHFEAVFVNLQVPFPAYFITKTMSVTR